MKKVNPWYKRLLLAAFIAVFVTPYGSLTNAGETAKDTDVPVGVESPAPPDAPEKKWWLPPKGEELLHKWKTKKSEEDLLRERIAELEGMVQPLKDKALAFDSILEAQKEQNKKDTDYFEELLEESKAEVERLVSQNATYRGAIKAFEDKENGLMFVEGCYVPTPK